MVIVILYLMFIYGLMALFTRPGKRVYDPHQRRKEWGIEFSNMVWQNRCKQIDLELGNPWRGYESKDKR